MRKAYTLIELLVVVVIIGILLSIMVPACQRACNGRSINGPQPISEVEQ